MTITITSDDPTINITGSVAIAASQPLTLTGAITLNSTGTINIQEVFNPQYAEYVADTAVHEGDYVAIQALTNSTAASIVSDNISGTLTNIPFTAGIVVPIKFTSFTSALNGRFLIYKDEA